MHCIKCGKETKGSDVFCQDCLLVMQTQPVKPGTAVHIPVRPASKKSASRKKTLSPEEQATKDRAMHRTSSRDSMLLFMLYSPFRIFGAAEAAIPRDSVNLY